MRFLLSPPVARSAKAAASRGRTRADTSVVRPLPSADNPSDVNRDNPQPHNKLFGQQCSPYCGCVVRFETTVDPKNQKIVSSHYVAKSVVATRDSETGMLKPTLTTKAHKPMLKKCTCSNLHALAEKVANYLPNQSLERVRNMTEFSQPRASSAFRHAVLAENGLSTTDTQCFDVIEEAFTAMLKGHMPQPRKARDGYHSHLVKAFQREHRLSGNIHDEDAVYRGQSRSSTPSDTSRLSLASPRPMSTLTMFDINAESWDYEQQYYQQQQQQQHPPLSTKPRVDSWLSFVDEQLKSEDCG